MRALETLLLAAVLALAPRTGDAAGERSRVDREAALWVGDLVEGERRCAIWSVDGDLQLEPGCVWSDADLLATPSDERILLPAWVPAHPVVAVSAPALIALGLLMPPLLPLWMALYLRGRRARLWEAELSLLWRDRVRGSLRTTLREIASGDGVGEAGRPARLRSPLTPHGRRSLRWFEGVDDPVALAGAWKALREGRAEPAQERRCVHHMVVELVRRGQERPARVLRVLRGFQERMLGGGETPVELAGRILAVVEPPLAATPTSPVEPPAPQPVVTTPTPQLPPALAARVDLVAGAPLLAELLVTLSPVLREHLDHWRRLDAISQELCGGGDVPAGYRATWSALHTTELISRVDTLIETLPEAMQGAESATQRWIPEDFSRIAAAWSALLPSGPVPRDGGRRLVDELCQHWLHALLTPYARLEQFLVEALPAELPGLAAPAPGPTLARLAVLLDYDYEPIVLYRHHEQDFDYRGNVHTVGITAAEGLGGLKPEGARAGLVFRVPDPLFLPRNDRYIATDARVWVFR